ncbi:MAG: UbiA family prenyltransferase [Thioalkalispiraceae bacterium]|jgi:4-hydroxybenzoate polyprenyltransferase
MVSRLAIVIRAMRVHQWVKNTLLFVPLILSHNLFDTGMFLATLTAFFAFSLCASAVYIINDIVDIEADRQHPTKCQRPFAAGLLSINTGVTLALVLFASAASIAYFISWPFVLTLFAYLLITSVYSFYIKRVVLLDILLLAGLYTFRIIAGSIAAGVNVSFWLLVFSVFIFLSLALVKRYSELANIDAKYEELVMRRGYFKSDMPLLLNLGIVSGYLSVLVLGLYIHDTQVMIHYSRPDWLWLVVAAVLFWVSRIWLVTFRGNMHEDPVMYAIHDRPSLVVMLVCISAIILAL